MKMILLKKQTAQLIARLILPHFNGTSFSIRQKAIELVEASIPRTLLACVFFKLANVINHANQFIFIRNINLFFTS
jgi:hypothetical protein